MNTNKSSNDNKNNNIPKPDFHDIQVSSHKILHILIIIYVFLIILAFILNVLINKNFFKHINLPIDFKRILFLSSVGILASIFILIQNYFFEDWFEGIKKFKNFLMLIIGPSSFYYALVLSLLSSLGEEFLFRLLLQPFLGLILTSFFFGVLHLEPYSNKFISACTLWAFLAGLVLGWLFETTNNIWPSVIAHFIVNFVGMLRLQRQYRIASRV